MGNGEVVPGPADQATTAGYRVEEKVAGGLVSDTATGRTGDVTGSVTVVGSRVTAAHFTVNMTTLKSDKSLRDTVLKTNAIQTAKYPTAAFTLTDPIALPDITPGKIYRVDAHGTLLLHGVSKSVTVALHYQQTNTGFVLLADMPIVMADYAITASQHRRCRIGAEPRLLRTPRESGEMKPQTVAQLSKPLALKTRLDRGVQTAPENRAGQQHWRVSGSIVVRCAGRPRQIPMSLQ